MFFGRDEMFSDVVTRQPQFSASVLRCLKGGARSVSEIARQLGMERGGRISDSLEQLEECGLSASGIAARILKRYQSLFGGGA